MKFRLKKNLEATAGIVDYGHPATVAAVFNNGTAINFLPQHFLAMFEACDEDSKIMVMGLEEWVEREKRINDPFIPSPTTDNEPTGMIAKTREDLDGSQIMEFEFKRGKKK